MCNIFLKNIRNKGMTLVELMVVISIFGIITAITIFDYGSFSSGVSIQNLGDDIALAIRKAQSYATGTQGSASFGFDNGYGVHFTIANPIAGSDAVGSNKSFIMYTDFNPPGGGYVFSNPSTCTKATPSNECSEIFQINGPEIIQEIYIQTGSDLQEVSALSSDSSVDIVFLRPNSEAMFCYKVSNTSGSACDIKDISRVNILLVNTQNGKSKTISVQNTGQIYIQ